MAVPSLRGEARTKPEHSGQPAHPVDLPCRQRGDAPQRAGSVLRLRRRRNQPGRPENSNSRVQDSNNAECERTEGFTFCPLAADVSMSNIPLYRRGTSATWPVADDGASGRSRLSTRHWQPDSSHPVSSSRHQFTGGLPHPQLPRRSPENPGWYRHRPDDAVSFTLFGEFLRFSPSNTSVTLDTLPSAG